MGIKSWLNKPAKPGSLKWQIQTGEKDPIKIAKDRYESKKQEYEEKLDIGEKVIVGKFLLGITTITCILGIIFLYSNMLLSTFFSGIGVFCLILFLYVNYGGNDGKG